MSELKFPVMLRKMWSGHDVQQWLDNQLAGYRLQPISEFDSYDTQRLEAATLRARIAELEAEYQSLNGANSELVEAHRDLLAERDGLCESFGKAVARTLALEAERDRYRERLEVEALYQESYNPNRAIAIRAVLGDKG